MQVEPRPMEMLVVDHLLDNTDLLSKNCKKRIRQLINHELLRRENRDLPPLAKTHKATYYKANLSIHNAAEKGDLDRLKHIVEKKGVSVDTKRFGKTALIDALRAKQTNTALYLLERGANVNSVDNEGNTPLHLAVKSNSRKLVAKLLEKKAEVAAVDHAGRTALYLAAENLWGEKMIKLLLPHYSVDEVNMAANDGTTPLHAALINSNYEQANALIHEKTLVNLVDNKGRAALHLAVMQKYPSVVKNLLDHNADPSLITHSGKTALHECCSSSYSDVCTLDALYRKKGARVINAKTKEGLTALHIAIECQNLSAIRWLLRHEADLTVLDNRGNDLETYIRIHGNNIVLQCFEDYNYQQESKKFSSPFMFF